MHHIRLFATEAIAAAFAWLFYWIGSTKADYRLFDAIRRLLRRAECAALKRGPSSWLTWYPLQCVYAAQLARRFVIRPRTTLALVRAARVLFPRNPPQEIVDAVAEAARLHLPGRTPPQYFYVRICDGSHAALDNVIFEGPEGSFWITLGISGGQFGNRPGEYLADGVTPQMLTRSKDRVDAAIAALAPLPTGTLRIPLHPADRTP